MRTYYDRRAGEYDEWWLGTGLYAERDRPGWDDEVAQLVGVLHGLPPARVLDVACGTGFLTRHLRGEVTAVDQSPAMVEIAAARMPYATVVRADAVPLPFADGAFDRLLTGHFYGHLLPDERTSFVAEAQRVASSLIVVDSALRDEVDAEQWQVRVLNDGSQHRVYKRYFAGPDLAAELGGGEVLMAGRWFVVVKA
jgi:demethylmenaquinone methyltransferase/2-methoxy-6-polyprenyl-1,4-benzoquinol methylase